MSSINTHGTSSLIFLCNNIKTLISEVATLPSTDLDFQEYKNSFKSLHLISFLALKVIFIGEWTNNNITTEHIIVKYSLQEALLLDYLLLIYIPDAYIIGSFPVKAILKFNNVFWIDIGTRHVAGWNFQFDKGCLMYLLTHIKAWRLTNHCALYILNINYHSL